MIFSTTFTMENEDGTTTQLPPLPVYIRQQQAELARLRQDGSDAEAIAVQEEYLASLWDAQREQQQQRAFRVGSRSLQRLQATAELTEAKIHANRAIRAYRLAVCLLQQEMAQCSSTEAKAYRQEAIDVCRDNIRHALTTYRRVIH